MDKLLASFISYGGGEVNRRLGTERIEGVGRGFGNGTRFVRNSRV